MTWLFPYMDPLFGEGFTISQDDLLRISRDVVRVALVEDDDSEKVEHDVRP